MQDERIARRYARALFNAAHQQNLLSEVDQYLTQMAEMMSLHPRLLQLIHNPMIPIDVKERAVLSALEHAEMPELVKALTILLIRKRRETLIQAVLQEFETLFDAELGEIRVTAKSARPLDEQQMQQLVSSLAQRTGRNIKLTTEVEPSLMGGLIVNIGDTVIDGSIRGRLAHLRGLLTAT